MADDSISFDLFDMKARQAIQQAVTLEEIIHWLESQPFIGAVRLEEAILKSRPPQRKFDVMIRSGEGQPVRVSLYVESISSQKFRLRELIAEG